MSVKPILTVVSLFVASASVSTAAVSAWFNEFHYSNSGADTDEFIEVAVPSSYADLANLQVTLYDGPGGVVYDSLTLLGFSTGVSANGYTLYHFTYAPNSIDDGPAGFALSHSGALIQFLSYEGSFTATEGPASGHTSVDIGYSEDGTDPVSSLGLTGTGSQYADFSWTKFQTPSRSTFNLNQTINAVPEPAEWGLICALGLFGVCGLHTWRQRRRAQSQTPIAS